MKDNTRNSHLLVSGSARATANGDNNYTESEKDQVLLGITIDSNLTFENHINNICKRVSQKLNALAKVAPYINIQKRRIIMKSFVTSQFGYCPSKSLVTIRMSEIYPLLACHGQKLNFF